MARLQQGITTAIGASLQASILRGKQNNGLADNSFILPSKAGTGVPIADSKAGTSVPPRITCTENKASL